MCLCVGRSKVGMCRKKHVSMLGRSMVGMCECIIPSCLG
jgi:hypothetical protein